MEDQAQSPPTEDAVWSDEFLAALACERDRMQRFASEHRRQLAEVEARLEDELGRISVALEVSQSADDGAERLVERTAQLEAQADRLEGLRRRLADAQPYLEQALARARDEQRSLLTELSERQESLEVRHAALVTAEAGLRQDRLALQLRRAAFDAEQADLAAAREQLNRRQRDLEAEFASAEAARRRTALQRRRIAADLNERRSMLLAELERRRADLDVRAAAQAAESEREQLTQRQSRERLESRCEALAAELHARTDEWRGAVAAAEGLRQELAALRNSHDALEMEVSRRQADCAAAAADARHCEDERDAATRRAERAEIQLQAAAEDLACLRTAAEQVRTALAHEQSQAAAADALRQQAESRATQLDGQLSEARRQLDIARQDFAQIQQELAAAQARATAAEAGLAAAQAAVKPAVETDTGVLHDLRRRLELALDDLKSERAVNAELQQKLAASPRGGAPPAPAASSGSDWESQKRRLLASLEGEDSEPSADTHRAAERLRAEQVIHATEQVVAEKDREIAELHQLLQQQSSSLGSMAVGAAAVADLLDRDEVVRHERDNLQNLQNEWREKLRQAEVDISVERAKLARERAELEDKLRQYEQHKQEAESAAGQPKTPSGKPARERWLTRLGLKDQSDH